ncbi:MAG TPA: hypothetical protein VFZ41_08205 [Solirubrobacterales bacterium]
MGSDAPKRGFPWLRWTLIGCAGWIVLMLAAGTPIGLLATPAAGPIGGWLVGGILYLVTGAATRR